jgi:hypothetical protein
MQELRCGARRASARSQRIGANNVGRANQRCTRATVTLLVLLLGLGFDDRLACWRAPGPYLSTTTLKASVGRKPQQPVISPAKKIRPDRCGARNPTTHSRKRANRVESEHVPDGWRLQGAMDAKAAKVPTGWLTIMSILRPTCAARAHQVVDRWQGPTCAGLAAQPLPGRPRRGRMGLRLGRAPRQRQRRRPAAGHPPGRHYAKPSPATALAIRRATLTPSDSGRSPPPAHRPAGPTRPGPGVCGPQPGRPPRSGTAGDRAAGVGPPRRGVRYLGRCRGGRAEQREPGPPTNHPGLGDHPPGRPQPPADQPTRQPARPPPRRPTDRSYQPRSAR